MDDSGLRMPTNESPRTMWEATLGRLQLQVTKPNYDTWLKGTVGIADEGNVFIVGAPSDFATEWLSTRLRPLITKAIACVAGRDIDVRFQVLGAPGQPAAAADADVTLRRPARLDTKPAPCLNPAFTFEAFVVGECNRLAHAAAMALAASPNTLYSPLFIWGPVGVGKSHLLHAIGHQALEGAADALLVSAEKFTNEFVRALKDHTIDAFRSRFRSADLLLVDDLQFIAGKQQTQEEFFHTFNDLQLAGKRIALTSNQPPHELTALSIQLRSRLQSGLLADISAPCVDTRAAILRAKANAHGATVSPEVIQYVAQRTPGSVRDLEGALNRLAAYARLTHQPLTLRLAREAMAAASADDSPPAPTPQHILRAVSAYFRISPDAITSRTRAKDITYARHLAMFLLREDAHASFTDIGRLMGGRDHATALYGHSRIRKELQVIPQTSLDLGAIRRHLRPAAA
jgi:chromosomal replication initiator protein